MNIADLMSDPEARMAFLSAHGTEIAHPPIQFARWSSQVISRDVPLDYFDPESHGNLVAAFRAAKKEGHATDIVLLSGAHTARRVDAFDRLEQYGCMVVIVSPTTKAFTARTSELLQVSVRRTVTTIDAARRLLSVDNDYEQLFGHKPEEVLGLATMPIVHPDDIDRGNRSFGQVLATPGAESRARLRAQHKNGNWIWLDITRTNLLHTDNPHIRTVALDVSAEMAAHLELERQSALIKTLSSATATAVLHVDAAGHIELANDRWADFTGETPARNLDDFILAAFDHPVALCEKLRAARAAGNDVSSMVNFSSAILGHRRGRLVQHIIRTSGEVERSSGVLITLDDVTESLTVPQEVAKQSRVDAVTKLQNPTGIREQVRAMLFETTDYELPLQLLHFTLDCFADLDEDDPGAIDYAAREVTQCLRLSVQPQDLLARVEPDEFVVVLRAISPDDAERVATRIQHQLASIAGMSSTMGRSAASKGDDYESLVAQARESDHRVSVTSGQPMFENDVIQPFQNFNPGA